MIASEWIRDALQEIGQQAAEQPLTADQIQTCIRYANRMMRAKAPLALGYSVISSASDEVTIPPYAEEWAVKGLAVRLASQFAAYDGLAELKMEANEAFKDVLRNQPLDISQSMPETLPVGSGNQQVWTQTFYPADPNLELTETGDYVEVEGG
jgi:hypothetical protein